MIRARRPAAMVAAIALAAGVPATGCEFAVNHPPTTAAIVGAVVGFGTCELNSDDHEACGIIGASAAAGLAIVTLVALWLGGDGHSVLIQDPPAPLPYDARPLRPTAAPPVAPELPATAPAAPEAPAAAPTPEAAPAPEAVPAAPPAPAAPAANPPPS
jgi:hypothetical protein